MSQAGSRHLSNMKGATRFLLFSRRSVLITTLTMLVILAKAGTAAAQTSGPCTPPVTNPIACENSKPGNPASEWDINGAGDPSIQGFATDISVNKGQTVRFKINTDASGYRLDIYRMGYYGGMGARKVASVLPSVSLPQNQPACLTDSSTGLIDCGNWSESAAWAVPADATSGIYFAKAVRTGTGGASHIVFVVRDDTGGSDILFQTSDTTWQAYNDYGGNSLYVGAPVGRAYKVSYNRPFNTRGNQFSRSWVFGSEYPMIRWLESNGYNVSYFTDVDSDRRGAEILEHKAFLFGGHDEYWSAGQRANMEAARDAGVHLALFSGNAVFWKTRWEASIDSSGISYRTLVSYKETHANLKIDPLPNVWTGTWRDPRFSPPADGGRPENALTGTIFMVNCCRADSILVPEPLGKLRFWRNTSVATLAPGQTATLPVGTLGYEWDEDRDNGFRPNGLMKLSSTIVSLTNEYLLDYGSSYGSGTATHSMTLYRHTSGALVFSTGTIRWSWGLDGNHDLDSATPTASTTPDVRMQQATVNLLADMGVQPATLQSGLVAATQSTDTTAPTSIITAPAAGSTVPAASTLTIMGTAIDVGGGIIGVVEVSVDGGATWFRATGTGNWSYVWTPTVTGSVTIRSRAVDDSGNVGIPSASVVVTVVEPQPGVCPCTIWSSATTPAVASHNDPNAVEMGVKFRSDADGVITGLRFYKGPSNTGPHIGNLWTSTGTLLASVAFTGETASGWQQVNLPTPVAITANTTYVASYHTTVGFYAGDSAYFAASGVDAPPLHALANGVAGGNGVYQYGAGGFPAQTYNANNYWVDVVFGTTGSGPDTTPPTVTAVSPTNGSASVATSANVTVTFSEAMDAATISTSTVELRDSASVLVPAVVTYDAATRTATLNPSGTLVTGTLYTATVKGGVAGVEDLAGNALATDFTWGFTTGSSITAGFVESVVFSGLTNPTAVRFSPDGRVFVAEKSGLIKVFDNLTDTSPTVFADLRTNVHNFWDRGLLGMALHPNFPTTPDVYVLYTYDAAIGGTAPRWGTAGATSDGCPTPPGATSDGCVVSGRLSRLQASGNVMVGNEQVLIEAWCQQYPSHSIGALAFGADGALYVSGGDGASFTFTDYGQDGNPLNPCGDPPVGIGGTQTPPTAEGGALRSQSVRRPVGEPRVLNGTILRVDPNTGDPMPDNPLFSSADPNARRIIAHGFRNPFRFTIRPGTNEVWVGDVGWTDWEEIDRVDSPTASVKNFGWPCYEGNGRQPGYDGANLNLCETLYSAPSNLTSPLFTYNHSANVVPGETCPTGSSSISGLAFYNGGNYPAAYNSALFFADYSRDCIWVMFRGPNGLPDPASRATFVPGAAGPVELQIGPGGDLFYVDFDGGTIRRIRYPSGNNPPTPVLQAIPLSGPAPLTVTFDGSGSSDLDPGDTLTYSWDFNGDNVFGDSTAPQTSFTYSIPGNYTVQLRVTDNRGASSTASVVISAGNTPPTATINSPLPGTTWQVGEVITFSGQATDPQQGTLPVSALSWTLILHHCPSNCHTHLIQTFSGVATGSFSAPDHEYLSYLELSLTATDSGGLQDTKSVLLDPRTVALSFQSSPSGLQLVVGSAGATTPFSRTVIVGSNNSISAPSPQTLAGTSYQFSSWSDGGAPSHNITAAPVPTTYVATYAAAPLPPVSLTDTTAADFSAGSPGAGIYLAQTGDGEVILAPVVGAEFAGTTLPAGWSAPTWQVGGAATVSSGALTVSGARAGTDALYGPGRSLEFVATFTGAPYQHVGFGLTFNETPWAIFSTFTGGSLYARTLTGGTATNTLIPGSWLGTPHRYRIDWNAASVIFSIDGTQVASHPVTISASMRPLASDYLMGDGSLSVDWLRMSPYSSSGTYLSRVFDAGGLVTWGTATWTSVTPSGTTLTISVREGNTPIPDATWTAFTTVPSSGAMIGGNSRYVQYRAVMTTTALNQTPVLETISVMGSP